MKVSPVAEENLFVCSCSSDRIGRFHFFSSIFLKPVLINLDPPDFADGANLICFPPLDGLLAGLPKTDYDATDVTSS